MLSHLQWSGQHGMTEYALGWSWELTSEVVGLNFSLRRWEFSFKSSYMYFILKIWREKFGNSYTVKAFKTSVECYKVGITTKQDCLCPPEGVSWSSPSHVIPVMPVWSGWGWSVQCGKWVPCYQIALLYRKKQMYVRMTAAFCILMCKTLCDLFLPGTAEISPSGKALDTTVCLTPSILHNVLPIFSLHFLDAL